MGCSSCGGEGSVIMGAPTLSPAMPTLAPSSGPVPMLPSEPSKPASPSPSAPAPGPGMNKPAAGRPGEIPAIPGATLYAPTIEDSAVLTLWVPAEAKVTINGRSTKSNGSRRQYVSFGLKPGFSYKYDVTATIIRDGQRVEENKTISLTAGQRGGLAFGFNTTTATEGLASSN